MTTPSTVRSPPRPAIATRLIPYRFLLIVLSLYAIGATWELLHREHPPDLFLDRRGSFADVVGELYPDDPGVQQLKVIQLGLCLQVQLSGGQPAPTCAQFANQDPILEARQLYERGIRTGKHIEDLHYDYLRFLVGTGAPAAEIQAAYKSWRASFPLSVRPDPRPAAWLGPVPTSAAPQLATEPE
jgi:hypothetical protein